MILHKLKTFMSRHRCTLLCIGPMSENCVDAAIELANEYDIPLILTASRRQIDSERFFGGYVNGWTTKTFANYVIDKDKKGKIILARDHGGPWQNDIEQKESMSLRRAMESAKASFHSDIESGFQIIHIDPSIDIYGRPGIDEVLDRVYELYEFCWMQAQQKGLDVVFEIGTEEQSGSTNTAEELDYTLSSIERFCSQNHLPLPAFVVIQTGTKVMETRNVGSFDVPVRVADELPPEIQVPQMINICKRYDILMKVHNTDYLSDESLAWHPRMGIHSANVAPEFGVAETKAFLGLLHLYSLDKLAEKFLTLSYERGKWSKWMMPETQADDTDRAIIAGHYVFATEEYRAIKQDVQGKLRGVGIDLDEFLKEQVKRSITRYLINFRLIRNS